MRLLRRTLVSSAIALALAASGAASAQFSGVYFFGDSYTDMGSYKPVLPPGTGMFTTNPGPVWAQPFAQYFGFSASPANQGGNDYAYGGARVTQLPGYPPVAPTAAAVPIATQIQQLLAKGPLDPNAIYSVWGGANDGFTALADYAAGKITLSQVQASIGLAAAQLAQQVGVLRANGAQYTLVWNYPSPSKTPAYAGDPAAGQIDALLGSFNATLYGALDKAGIPTIRVNTQALVNEVVASPAAYGFANVTAPACGATPSLVCTSANLVAPNAASTYFFADGVHPTTAAHAVFAQLAESMITGPQQMGALAEGPLAVEQASFRALDNRMWSSLNAPGSQAKLNGWAAYDYGSTDVQAGPNNGSARTNTLVVGGDMKVSDRMLVGLMATFAESKGDFGGAGGGYTMRAPIGTIYAGYGDGPWYVGTTVGVGSLDYTDINRAIPLGAAVRTENAEARGAEYTGRLLGGYWFTMKDLLHGPYARVTWTKATVHSFSETSTDSTALYYDDQKRYQLLWSAGWQVAGSFGAIRPYARATWEYDSRDQLRFVSASSVTLGGNYSVPVAKPDNSYALFNVGASTEFGGVTGFLSGSGTAGRGDGNYWAVTVGLRMPL
jgi:outer membrane lipase/esterase